MVRARPRDRVKSRICRRAKYCRRLLWEDEFTDDTTLKMAQVTGLLCGKPYVTKTSSFRVIHDD
ncbi:hypothetical protein KIN20_016860 [Parelaphostrongylus tenuis]|uniref:Uncharacterized protein n=1 Tax=Parelaphostrongylus tenuis TaxID=148309 RepID=A0AAD5QR24_PARTN|nr:hypothetical protein KIN20_016860 [Parelaphostrongylus tenuis]